MTASTHCLRFFTANVETFEDVVAKFRAKRESDASMEAGLNGPTCARVEESLSKAPDPKEVFMATFSSEDTARDWLRLNIEFLDCLAVKYPDGWMVGCRVLQEPWKARV